MHIFNGRQVLGYEAQMVALWKSNWTLINTLKDIQGSLSLDDPQQLAIFNRIERALERV